MSEAFIFIARWDAITACRRSLSTELMLPHGAMQSPHELKSGDTLWIAGAKGRRVILFARMLVRSISVLDDGPQVGNLVIGADPIVSVATRSTTGDDMQWDIGSLTTAYAILRVQPIVSSLDAQLNSFVRDRMATSFTFPALPSGLVLSQRMTESDLPGLARYVVCEVRRQLTLDRLTRYAKTPENWTPYESTAWIILTQQFRFPADAATKAINSVIVGAAVVALQETASDQSLQAVPIVDIDLEPVDPSEVFARHFLSANIPPTEWDEIERVAKLERAEKQHQAIVRDVAKFLQMTGITPLASDSVDLAVRSPLQLVLLEIKSANLSNFLEQSYKGALQVLRYRHAFGRASTTPVTSIVIIECCGNPSVQTYAVEFLASIGVHLLVYDLAEPWPKRVSGFLPLISA